MAFHYGVFAHDQPGRFSGSSGVAADNNCFLSQTGATLTGFNDWNAITYVVSPQQALVAKPAIETPNKACGLE